MTINEKRYMQMEKCKEFFFELVNELSESYELMPSCNHDASFYLCKKGTLDEVTYSSKPEDSFRISDHWNWYANIRKCPEPYYIQCLNRDLPKAHKRTEYGQSSKPIMADCVAIFKNGKYHTVFGEYYDSANRKWCWKNTSVKEVIAQYI